MAPVNFSFSTEAIPSDNNSSLLPGVLKQAKISGQSSLEKNNFSVSVNSYLFGPTTLNFWSANEVKYDRTKRDCLQYPKNEYGLFHVQEGNAEIGQRGRKILTHPGDCFLVNLGEPFYIHCPSCFRFKALRLLSSVLQIAIPSPQEATAIVFSKQSDWVKALTAILDTLTPETVDRLSFAHMPILQHICCLLSHTIDPENQLLRSNKASMLNRLRESLAVSFFNPDFSPAKLAKEQKISTRTLYSVFSNAGSSFGQELMSLRMDHACRLLDDPRFDIKTIAEIGQLVGILQPSHFATCFRKKHGIAPSTYRTLRQGKLAKSS